jgi:hypothetical protein
VKLSLHFLAIITVGMQEDIFDPALCVAVFTGVTARGAQVVCVQGLENKGLWLPRGARDNSVKKDLYILSALRTVSLLLSLEW